MRSMPCQRVGHLMPHNHSKAIVVLRPGIIPCQKATLPPGKTKALFSLPWITLNSHLYAGLSASAATR
jgi:hypothetical protein